MHTSRHLIPFGSALLFGSSLLAQLYVPGQYPTIQAAINAAATGAEIVVAPGTYAITSAINTLGKALTLRADGQVTLDGMGTGRVFQISNHETPSTVIRGFVIQNGRAPDGGYGGVRNGEGGGAVLVFWASPKFVDCEFRACRSGDGLPGPTSSNGNGLTGGRGGDGGVIYAEQGDPVFERCRFIANHGGAGGAGGGGDDGSGGGAVGHAGGYGGRGGHGSAVFATGSYSQLRFFNCLFAANICGEGGAGGAGGAGADAGVILGQYWGPGGNGGNGGTGGAGGDGIVYADGSATVWLENCTFADNYPARGGTPGAGGASGDGTFAGQAGANGSLGAPGLETGIHGTPTSAIDNSAFWNRISPIGSSTTLPTVDLTGGIVANRCAGRASLASNTPVLLTSNPFGADFAPLPNGPLVDAGDAALLPANITLDLDRRPRRFDHPSLPGLLDIGALEDHSGEFVAHECTANAPDTIGTSGTPALGAPLQVTVDAPSQFFPMPSIAVLAASTVGPVPGCNAMLPGFHMDPALPGALLLQQPFVVAAALWLGAPTAFQVAVPQNDLLLGQSLWLQGAMLDPTTGHLGLTGGVRAFLGE